MQRRNSNPSAFVQPLVELDLAVLSQIAGGDGPNGGWGIPSSPTSGSPPTEITADEVFGPNGGWKTDGPNGGW